MVHQWMNFVATLDHRVLSSVMWLFVTAAIMVPLERVSALHPQVLFRRDFSKDLAYYFIGSLVPAFLMVFTTTVVGEVGRLVLPQPWLQLMASLPLWLKLALVLVVGDIGYYWGHRWAHEWPGIWRLHAVHHSPSQLDWLVNTRAHPVDLVFARTVSYIPLFFLGLVQGGHQTGVDPLLAWLTIFNTFWAFFIHANTKIRLGPLEYLMTSPAYHHWHHANDDPSVVNKNYAALFPWVDRLFGTHHLPKSRFPASYGIAHPLPTSLWGQLSEPFRAPRGQ